MPAAPTYPGAAWENAPKVNLTFVNPSPPEIARSPRAPFVGHLACMADGEIRVLGPRRLSSIPHQFQIHAMVGVAFNGRLLRHCRRCRSLARLSQRPPLCFENPESATPRVIVVASLEDRAGRPTWRTACGRNTVRALKYETCTMKHHGSFELGDACIAWSVTPASTEGNVEPVL